MKLTGCTYYNSVFVRLVAYTPEDNNSYIRCHFYTPEAYANLSRWQRFKLWLKTKLKGGIIVKTLAFLSVFLFAATTNAGPFGIFGRRTSSCGSQSACAVSACEVAIQAPKEPLPTPKPTPVPPVPVVVPVAQDACGAAISVDVGRQHRLRNWWSNRRHVFGGRRGGCQ